MWPLFLRKSTLVALAGGSWFPKGRSQEDEPHCANAYQVSACIILANVSLAKRVTWPLPESIGEGTTQEQHGRGCCWNSPPQTASQGVCPTDCLSQVTASSCVPPHWREGPELEEKGQESLSMKSEFSFRSITYVASFSRGTK